MILRLFTLLLITLSLHAGSLTLSGSVISDNQKMISSRYMGHIKDIYVSEGDIVKKDTLLYEIDSKEIDAQKAQVKLAIAQAELALSMNQNQYENVKVNLERHKRLYEKDMVSKYELETLQLHEKNLKAQVDIAHKQVTQAKEQLKTIQNQYNYLNIKAPNDGVVISKKIRSGEMAIPGVPVIVLSDLSDLKIETEISESNLKDAMIGKSVALEIPSIGFQGEGKISAIIPSSNPMTHTFRIKVAFEAKNKQVYPGMFANVILETQD